MLVNSLPDISVIRLYDMQWSNITNRFVSEYFNIAVAADGKSFTIEITGYNVAGIYPSAPLSGTPSSNVCEIEADSVAGSRATGGELMTLILNVRDASIPSPS